MENTQAIYTSLGQVMAEMGAIGKEHLSAVGFAARTIESVMNHIHPLFAKAGIVMMPSVKSVEYNERLNEKGRLVIWARVIMRYSFVSTKDGSRSVAQFAGEGMDYGSDKATNKAQTSALKYMLLQVFCVPTKELEDNDADRSNVNLEAFEENLKEAEAWISVDFPELLQQAKSEDDLRNIKQIAMDYGVLPQVTQKLKTKHLQLTLIQTSKPK